MIIVNALLPVVFSPGPGKELRYGVTEARIPWVERSEAPIAVQGRIPRVGHDNGVVIEYRSHEGRLWEKTRFQREKVLPRGIQRLGVAGWVDAGKDDYQKRLVMQHPFGAVEVYPWRNEPIPFDENAESNPSFGVAAEIVRRNAHRSLFVGSDVWRASPGPVVVAEISTHMHPEKVSIYPVHSGPRHFVPSDLLYSGLEAERLAEVYDQHGLKIDCLDMLPHVRSHKGWNTDSVVEHVFAVEFTMAAWTLLSEIKDWRVGEVSQEKLIQVTQLREALSSMVEAGLLGMPWKKSGTPVPHQNLALGDVAHLLEPVQDLVDGGMDFLPSYRMGWDVLLSEAGRRLAMTLDANKFMGSL